eukprot:COSAG04_NODE_4725_length_1923_cov_3.663925_2_plen_113_part_01
MRYIKIKDYRLGIPHLFLSLCIVFYIFGVQLVYNGGYLLKDTAITGTVRVTLQAPEEPMAGGGRGAVARIPADRLDYCLNDCTGPAGDSPRAFAPDVPHCPPLCEPAPPPPPT